MFMLVSLGQYQIQFGDQCWQIIQGHYSNPRAAVGSMADHRHASRQSLARGLVDGVPKPERFGSLAFDVDTGQTDNVRIACSPAILLGAVAVDTEQFTQFCG